MLRVTRPVVLIALALAAAGVAATLLLRSGPSEYQDPRVPIPRQRSYPWMSLETWWERHRRTLSAPERSRAEVVFIGDSIIEGFDRKTWQARYGSLHALNLGIGGDLTQHVLWRLQNGALDGLHPRVAVVLIGTNNLGRERVTCQDVADAITAVVRETQQRLPSTRILLLAVLPRGQRPGTPARQHIVEINRELAKLEDPPRLRFLDIGARFLAQDGTIPLRLMADSLHPTSEGYRVFADAIQGTLDEMLR